MSGAARRWSMRLTAILPDVKTSDCTKCGEKINYASHRQEKMFDISPINVAWVLLKLKQIIVPILRSQLACIVRTHNTTHPYPAKKRFPQISIYLPRLQSKDGVLEAPNGAHFTPCSLNGYDSTINFHSDLRPPKVAPADPNFRLPMI